jgi:hypothetical protein
MLITEGDEDEHCRLHDTTEGIDEARPLTDPFPDLP